MEGSLSELWWKFLIPWIVSILKGMYIHCNFKVFVLLRKFLFVDHLVSTSGEPVRCLHLECQSMLSAQWYECNSCCYFYFMLGHELSFMTLLVIHKTELNWDLLKRKKLKEKYDGFTNHHMLLCFMNYCIFF